MCKDNQEDNQEELLFQFTCKKCEGIEFVEEYDDIFKMGKICFSCHREMLKAKDLKSIANNKKKNKLKKEQAARKRRKKAMMLRWEEQQENNNEEDRD